MKAAFLTLGCKTNSYDTQAMQTLLRAEGYEITVRVQEADVIVINTCAVTNVSEAKSRQAIRRAVKQSPNAIVIAAGCYTQINPEDVAALEGVDAVVGIKDRARLPRIIEAARQRKINAVGDVSHEVHYEALKIDACADKTRAFIKIQEGCNYFCAYCIIPYARGRSRSRALGDIVREVENIVRNGYREIVLTGIHITSYGKDLPQNIGLIDVIEAVAKTGIARIRLGSLEPGQLDTAFLSRLSEIKTICPSFHISLQSGSDNTLKRMNRRYTVEEYSVVVENVRRFFPNASITTDVIAGFPGEVEADFQDSLTFCEQIGFMKIHSFPYSKKVGTKAAQMRDQLLTKEKEARARQYVALSERLAEQFFQTQCGKEEEVLFEREKAGVYEGYTRNYIPVKVRAKEDISGKIFCVRLLGLADGGMTGELLKADES